MAYFIVLVSWFIFGLMIGYAFGWHAGRNHG